MRLILSLLLTLTLTVSVISNAAILKTKIEDNGVSVLVPPKFTQEYAQQWNELGNILQKVQVPVLTLEVQGYGGEVMVLNKFANSLLYSQKTGTSINAVIIGPAYSAHAFLVCYADNVTFEPQGALMFHSGAIQESLLFGLIEYRNIELNPAERLLQNSVLDRCKTNGILTDADIETINAGNDVYVYINNGKLEKVYAVDDEGYESALKQIFHILAYIFGGLFIIGAIKRL